MLQIHFLLFFPSDKSMTIVKEEFEVLGEFENVTEEGWRSKPKNHECHVQAFYEGTVEQMRMMKELVAKIIERRSCSDG